MPRPWLGFRHDHFHGIGRGAKDPADFRDVLDGIENVDGVALFHEDDERVAAGKGEGVLLGQANQVRVVAGPADQRRAGRFAKGDAKLDFRHSLHNRFMKILDGLDKVGLSEDKVHVRRVCRS